ncbi:YadA-like family protein [Bartonella sp. DGB1]|uniref:YadA-like family protein n=1 Tax=Bartonella sp. DGB1 TaxID=3239807 RepID=UPI0035246BAE
MLFKSNKNNLVSFNKRIIAKLRLACRILGLKRKKSRRSFGFPGKNSLYVITCLTISIGLLGEATAANLSFGGGSNFSSNEATQGTPRASHGTIILSGTADHCGVDNIKGRSSFTGNSISAEESYQRFIDNPAFNGYKPYGTSESSVNFTGDGTTTNNVGYQSSKTGGSDNRMPVANGVYSTSIGCGAYTTGNYSTAFGANATARGGASQAFGVGALAIGPASMAFGVSSRAEGHSSIALGPLADAGLNFSVAIGKGATAAINSGDVALGSESTTGSVIRNPGININGDVYRFAGTDPFASVSVGTKKRQRVISNVAAGQTDADSTDAVNGSQLNAAYRALVALKKTADNTSSQLVNAFSSKSSYDADTGDIKVSLAFGGKTYNSLQSVLNTIHLGNYSGWSFRVGSGTVEKVDNEDVITFTEGNNIKITNVDKNITVALADNFTLDSIQIKDGPVINNTGIDMGDKKITNVSKGDISNTSTDAVNGAQLYEVTQQITNTNTKLDNFGSNLSAAFSPTSSYDTTTGNLTVSLSFGGNSYNSVQSALDAIHLGNYSGWSFQVGTGNVEKVASEDVVTFTEGNNIKITNVDKNITVALADDFTLDSIQIKDGPVINNTGINMGDKKITNVSKGDISNTSTDAVNGAQLYDVTQQITNTNIKLTNTNIKLDNFGSNLSAAFSPNSSYDTTTGNLKVSLAFGGNSYNSVQSALDAIHLGNYSGWSFRVGSGTVEKVANEDVVTFTEGNNIKITNVDKNITIALSDDFTLDSVHIKDGPVINNTGIDMGDKKITNVSKGDISNTSTDAVNGAQLYDVTQQIINTNGKLDNFGSNLSAAFSPNSSYDTTTGDLKVSLAFGGKTYNSVQSALDAIHLGNYSGWSFRVGSGTVEKVANEDVVTFTEGNNIKITNVDKNITIALSDNFTLDSVHIKDGPVINNTGIDMGDKKITNVSKGDISNTSTDAVTGGQIYDLANSIAKIFGGGAKVNGSGVIEAPTYKIGGKNYDDIGNFIKALNENIDSIRNNVKQIDKMITNKEIKQKYVNINSEKADSVATGVDSVAIGPDANSTGAGSVAIGDGASALTDSSVAIGQNSKTQETAGTKHIVVRGKEVSVAGGAPVGTVSVGDAGKERTVTNVAAGRVAADSTDAVNGSQLNAIKEEVNNIIADGIHYDKGKNSVTFEAPGSKEPVLLRNVANGIELTDAVNVGQLKSGLDDIKSYVDARLEHSHNSASEAGAVGLAAASLRYDNKPGKLSLGLGTGYWKGATAVAFGAGYTNMDSSIRGNVTGSFSNTAWGVSAGVTFTIN